MYSRLLTCVVALSVVLMSSTAMAAKDSKKTKKAPAPEKTSEPSDWTFTPGAFYGSKALSSSDWGPLKTQAEMGVSVAFANSNWPYVGVVEYSTSSVSGKVDPEDPDFKSDGATTEIGLGLRHLIESSSDTLKYFIEGGVVQISAEQKFTDTITNEKFKFSGSGTGYWVGGAVDYLVSDTLSVGVEGRLSSGDVKFDGLKANAGGTHLGLTVRYYPE